MPRLRVKRVIIGLMLSIALIGSALAYTAWRLSWQQPVWYAPPDVRSERVLRIADDAEYDLLQKTQQLRSQDEHWKLRLTSAQVNAWLAARLPQWIEHDADLRWPDQLGTPQVLFESSHIRIAIPIRSPDSTRTVVGTLQPSISADGRLALPLTNVALGRIWIPGEPLSRLIDAIEVAAPEFLNTTRVQQAIDVLSGRSTLSSDYVLGDGRRVRIESIVIADDAVELTAVTLSPPRSDS